MGRPSTAVAISIGCRLAWRAASEERFLDLLLHLSQEDLSCTRAIPTARPCTGPGASPQNEMPSEQGDQPVAGAVSFNVPPSSYERESSRLFFEGKHLPAPSGRLSIL